MAFTIGRIAHQISLSVRSNNYMKSSAPFTLHGRVFFTDLWFNHITRAHHVTARISQPFASRVFRQPTCTLGSLDKKCAIVRIVERPTFNGFFKGSTVEEDEHLGAFGLPVVVFVHRSPPQKQNKKQAQPKVSWREKARGRSHARPQPTKKRARRTNGQPGAPPSVLPPKQKKEAQNPEHDMQRRACGEADLAGDLP